MIYKIVERSAWLEACAAGVYVGSADDVRDGFIHFSAPHQVHGTAAKHFKGIPDLLLVAIPEQDLGEKLVWEQSRGGDLFPHLYGPLTTACAVWEKPLPLDADGIPKIPEGLEA